MVEARTSFESVLVETCSKTGTSETKSSIIREGSVQLSIGKRHSIQHVLLPIIELNWITFVTEFHR